MTLEIVYQDDFLIVINKPNGLLVHKSKYANEANEYAVQVLRDQVGTKVWPCHRIDRKTSGVLVFTLNQEMNSLIQQQFANSQINKTYWAIVRGYTDDDGSIDYALTNDKGKTQEAITRYKTIKRSEIPLALGKHNTSRYSLVEVYPQHGRMHQIRKHFAHISHPIIGDRPHGCNKQNRLFKQQWNVTNMMLHAKELEINHPYTNHTIHFSASLSESFKEAQQLLNLEI